jgi:hypothetical protein
MFKSLSYRKKLEYRAKLGMTRESDKDEGVEVG